MATYVFEGFNDEFSRRDYFQWYDTVGYYGNANDSANLFKWNFLGAGGALNRGASDGTSGDSLCLELRRPPGFTLDLAAPLPKVAWHNVPFPHTVGDTTAAVMSDAASNYSVVVGFAVNSLASKAALNPATGAITTVADNKYFEIYGHTLSGGSLLASEITRFTIEVSADVNDATRLLLLFKENGSVVATFYLPDSVASITDDSEYVDGTNDYRWRTSSGWFLGVGGIFLEFLLTATSVQVYANGAQLLTDSGATSASLNFSGLTGWGFFGVAEQSTYIDDFYIIEGSARLGYNTRVLRAHNYGTTLASNDSWLGGDPFGSPSQEGSSSLYTNTNGATALYNFFTGFQPLIGLPETDVHSLQIKFVARADDLDRPAADNSRVEPVWQYPAGLAEILPTNAPITAPLVGYQRNYIFPPVDCLPDSSSGSDTCINLTTDMILTGRFGIRYLV